MAYKCCINGLQEFLPNSDVERILGGSGLILVGGFKMTGGAILTFAGVATSHLGIGFGGITAGTITGLSGASDIEQGINEIKLGLRNDRTTRTGNYVRDTLYDGNDTIYHLSTGTAAMAGMLLKPYVFPRNNPVLAGGEQKDIAKKAAMGADDSRMTSSPYDLKPTHSQTLSNNKMNALINDIRANGIQEPISYIEYNGQMYVVDGHHRLSAAKRLGLTEVPIREVELPYAGYNTIDDLLWFN